MGDKGLNDLLRWSIENTATGPDGTTETAPSQRSTLNAEALASIMGGPSDADLMRESMAVVQSTDPEVTLESKLTAFDNLEQLIESLDNANLLSKLGLWTPLLSCLAHSEAEIRLMAAWCVGTAVQNNEPSQERLVALGGVEKLVRMAVGKRLAAPSSSSSSSSTEEGTAATDEKKTEGGDAAKEGEGEREGEEETKTVRRKAVYALSSAVRNYQPAMDVAAAELRRQGHGEHVGDEGKSVDATDMDAVDVVINGLKEKVASA
ncbi:nucleotide exchange factor Fes1-domain-containing protein [Xylaria venustula]|nr:nucleotide exchange factor Fes1-domain-containing protein [Xylaria venustula]